MLVHQCEGQLQAQFRSTQKSGAARERLRGDVHMRAEQRKDLFNESPGLPCVWLEGGEGVLQGAQASGCLFSGHRRSNW